MDLINTLSNYILHLDKYLAQIINQYGYLTYVFLFLIIFIETGVVIMPFLPGDSLLFAAGTLAGLGHLNIFVLIGTLTLAAILGDTVNYWIGHFFGKRILANPRIPLNEKHIEKTHEFFKKHGKKTIILARFVPIVRTFAPFVAGIGNMEYKEFFSYNVIGAVIWVFSLTLAGFFFGSVPVVRQNFEYVVIGIVVISIAPMLLHFIQGKLAAKKEKKTVPKE